MTVRVLIGVAVAAVVLVLTGCFAQKSDSTLKPSANTMGDEAPDRLRARVHTELASSYFELGNIPVALEEAKEALRADTNYGPAHNIMGLLYALLKEDRLAEESFRRAVQISPQDSDANHNYGQFLCQRKREKEGIGYFLAAVKNPLYPAPDRSYTNAGVCARRQGDMAAAESYFQTALQTRPSQTQALYNMAEISYTRGDFTAARGYLARLTKVAQPNAEVLWLGVRVERRLGDRNSEMSYAMQLRKTFPDSKEARALASGEELK